MVDMTSAMNITICVHDRACQNASIRPVGTKAPGALVIPSGVAPKSLPTWRIDPCPLKLES